MRRRGKSGAGGGRNKRRRRRRKRVANKAEESKIERETEDFFFIYFLSNSVSFLLTTDSIVPDEDKMARHGIRSDQANISSLLPSIKILYSLYRKCVMGTLPGAQ